MNKVLGVTVCVLVVVCGWLLLRPRIAGATLEQLYRKDNAGNVQVVSGGVGTSAYVVWVADGNVNAYVLCYDGTSKRVSFDR